MIDQDYLNRYFSNVWNSSIHYIYSGEAILDKIKPSDYVLDVGCGYHPFKGKIKHLIGIDPANDNADHITTIEEYTPDRLFDVALCLGSINFGTDQIITKQIQKVNSCLKEHARVFWRCNPGLQDHNNSECEKINFYPWSFEQLNEYARHFGFEQKGCAIDTNGTNIRLYAEWHR